MYVYNCDFFTVDCSLTIMESLRGPMNSIHYRDIQSCKDDKSFNHWFHGDDKEQTKLGLDASDDGVKRKLW